MWALPAQVRVLPLTNYFAQNLFYIENSGCHATYIENSGCHATYIENSGCQATYIENSGCQATYIENSGCRLTLKIVVVRRLKISNANHNLGLFYF